MSQSSDKRKSSYKGEEDIEDVTVILIKKTGI
jgi:hypothetical protein